MNKIVLASGDVHTAYVCNKITFVSPKAVINGRCGCGVYAGELRSGFLETKVNTL